MREVVQISQAININLSEADINSVLEMLQQLDPNSKTSMLQDVESKERPRWICSQVNYVRWGSNTRYQHQSTGYSTIS